MGTLYRFKLLEDGTIQTRIINNYTTTCAWITYSHNSATVWVDKHKIDKMYHNAVYTFNSDIDRAKKIMYDTFVNKAKNAYDEFEKYAKLAETLV